MMTELYGDINFGFVWLMIAGEILIIVISFWLAKFWPEKSKSWPTPCEFRFNCRNINGDCCHTFRKDTCPFWQPIKR